MWAEFVVSVVFGLVVLILPGYFLSRPFAVGRCSSLAIAPAVSIAFYSFVGIACGVAGCRCSWLVCFVPLLLFSLAVFVADICWHRCRHKPAGPLNQRRSSACSLRNGVLFGAYCVIGLVAASLVFLWNLDGADAFVQEYDNVSHLSRIQTFVQFGDWSSFSSSYYPDGSLVDPLPSSAFYPSAWHILAAMLVEAVGVPVTLSVNAVNYLFVALVLPMGFFLLFRAVFPGRFLIQICGCACMLAFAAFPWELLVFGPIYPNLASLCLSPAVAAVFVYATGSRTVSQRIAGFAGLVIGAVALVMLQPNSLFTLAVFLAPYCAWSIYVSVEVRLSDREPAIARFAGVAACAAFVVFACALWVVAYRLPALQSLVSFEWPAFAEKGQAVFNALSLSFKDTNPQPILAILVGLGVIFTLFHRRYLWISASFMIMSFMYIVDASTNSGLKHLLTGFWYTDPWRIGANAALFGVPLASMGLYGLVATVRGVGERAFEGAGRSRTVLNAVCLLLGAAVMCGIYYPGSSGSAFGGMVGSIREAYSSSRDNVLNPEEKVFLERVSEVVPNGSLVLNEPNDGSAFAYALFGLNVYYRSMDHYDESNETVESETIRLGLDEISSDDDVRQAVDALGATYLLQLDQADWNTENRYLFSYQSEYYTDMWTGIDAVDDSTPGFEIVLSEGDMRLYRIL